MKNPFLFNPSYKNRVYIIFFIYLLILTLPYFFDFRTMLLIVDILSILITIIIWKNDGILKLDLTKFKYAIYYIFLLFFSSYIFPKSNMLVIDTFLHAPLREEIIFRLFMIGIFYKYYKSDSENPRYFLYIVIISNFIFMTLHLNVIIFFMGLFFTIIYIKGGLISSMLAHTLFNLYLSNEYYFIKVLIFLPLLFTISDIQFFVTKLNKKLITEDL